MRTTWTIASVSGSRPSSCSRGAPAILIQDGDFRTPPHEWSRLTQCRDRVREVIARSGRVEVEGHLDYEWVGTASLVAPTTLMTNRHVAQEFCARQGRTWTFRQGMTSRIDFLGELGSTTSMEFEITDVIGLHEKHDLALLRVQSASPDGRVLPDPLTVAASEPRDLLGRDVSSSATRRWTVAATNRSSFARSSLTSTT